MTTLPEDYAAICTVPHRDTVLRLAFDDYARCYGQGALFDLDRLNSLLAAHDQPLATMTEIDAYYGNPVPAESLN